MNRRTIAVGLALAVTTLTGGCSVSGSSDTYKLTVYFEKTPSLYEKSRVKVMGANVGTIKSLKVEGGRVKAELEVDGKVPVPADAHAIILSASTVGERNIILAPAWKPGMERMKPNAVIPQERTDLPIEIDAALTAFTKLAESVDAKKLQDVFGDGARLLEGNGPKINEGLGKIADLTSTLAAQDKRIIGLATDLNELAKSLNERDEKLKALFTAFNKAGGMLAAKRNSLKGFLAGLEAIIKDGGGLVDIYHKKLPSAVATMSELVMTFKANSESVGQAIAGLDKFVRSADRMWDRKRNLITIRVHLSAVARTFLQPIFDVMGWGKVPCVAKPIGNCVDTPATDKVGGKAKS